jgi:hypothetical protein
MASKVLTEVQSIPHPHPKDAMGVDTIKSAPKNETTGHESYAIQKSQSKNATEKVKADKKHERFDKTSIPQ